MKSQYVLTVNEELLQAKRRQARGLLEHGCNNGLGLDIGYRDQEVLCDFLGVFEATEQLLANKLNGDFPIEVKTPYVDMYAASVAAQYVADKHGVNMVAEGCVAPLPFEEMNGQSRRSLAVFSQRLREYINRGDESLDVLVGGISAAASHAAMQEQYGLVRDASAAFKIAIGDRQYAGLAPDGFRSMLEDGERVAEPMVGNDDLMTGLGEILYMMRNYNLESQTNPFIEAGLLLPRTVLVSGPPGTGKSTGVNNLYFETQDICLHEGLAPVHIHRIDNSLKTTFQNESVQKVQYIFSQIDTVPGIHLTLIDDADMVLFARNTLGVSGEEQKFSHAIMQRLEDGRGIRRKGNELYVAISNYVGNLDGALFGRSIEDRFIALGPQTSEEYAQLFKYKLAGIEQQGRLQVEDWARIGAAVKGDSGRDVKNISISAARRSLRRGSLDQRMHNLSTVDVQAIISEKGIPVTDEVLLDEIASYHTFKNQELERAHQEVIDKRCDDIVLEAKVQAAVKRRIREEFPEG